MVTKGVILLSEKELIKQIELLKTIQADLSDSDNDEWHILMREIDECEQELDEMRRKK